MSRAELQARSLYDTMHLATVDEEVKRHLIIMMLSNPSEHGIEPYSAEELLLHLEDSNRAIANGEVLSMAEADAEMERFVNAL